MAKTEQEVFDFVATHMFTQGVQAIGHNGPARSAPICLYRGPNGTKCAVGAMITDEEYDPSMEGYSACDLVYLKGVKVNDDIKANAELLDRLQTVHDAPSNWESNDRMKMALRYVAQEHDLKTSVLENLTLYH